MAKFNPEDYRVKENSDSKSASKFDPEKYRVKDSSRDQSIPAEAALEGFGEGATMGYLNNIQAATEPLVFGAMNLPTRAANLFKDEKDKTPLVESDNYTVARDAYNKRQETLQKENPASFGVGQIAGTMASSIPVAKAAQGATWAARAGQAAKAGAAYGAIQNTSETQGEAGNLDLGERLINTGAGAAFGAASSIGADALSAGAKSTIKSLGNIKQAAGERLKDSAESLAFKSTGASLKDFRNAYSKNEINEIGRYLLDKGIVKLGDSVDDIAKKTLEYKQLAGKALDKVYSDADATLKTMISQKGFDPIRDKKRILEAAKNELGDTVGSQAALEKISKYIDDVAVSHVDDVLAKNGNTLGQYEVMSPRRSNEIKGAMDEQINYARNPMAKEPATEKAFSGARTELNKIVGESMDELGGSAAAQQLKAANKQYGLAAKTNQISQDRVNRESANNMFSLTDKIAGSGAGLYTLATGDWESGLALLAAKKGFEKYGVTGLAKLADSASKKLLANPQYVTMAQKNPQAFKSAVFGLVEKMGSNITDSFALPKAASNEQPKKGPEKWMAVGASKLQEHENSGFTPEQIEKIKNTKKGKELLIQASDLAPNSKAMNKIIEQIRSGALDQGGE